MFEVRLNLSNYGGETALSVAHPCVFSKLSENMFSLYLSSAQAIPEEDIEAIWNMPSQHGRQTSHVLLVTAMPLAGLRERASILLQTPMTPIVAQDTKDLFASLRELDAKLAAWQFTAGVGWEYQVLGKHELGPGEDFITSSVWPGDLHTYKNRQAAKGWNSYRVVRIICQCLMINCLERLIPPEDLLMHPKFTSSQRIIQKLADAICSTVSYITMMGPNGPGQEPRRHYWRSDWKTPTDLTSSDDVSKPRIRCDLENHQPASLNIGSLGIIWDLHIVATLPWTSQEQRDWARYQMDVLGKERGLDQAQVLRALGDEQRIARDRVVCLTDMAPLPYEPIGDDPFELFIDPALRSNASISLL